MSVRLPHSLHAWGGDAFAAALKAELEALAPGLLPLQALVEHGGSVGEGNRVVRVLGAAADAAAISARVGVFFTETVGGCSCGDEPEVKEVYGELVVRIDRRSGEASFAPAGQ